MNKIINWVKKVKLSQIIWTFLAGALLLFNTACNSVQATEPSNRPNVPSGVQPDNSEWRDVPLRDHPLWGPVISSETQPSTSKKRSEYDKSKTY